MDEVVIAEEWPHNLRILKHEFAVIDKLIRFRVDADMFENGLKTLLVWT